MRFVAFGCSNTWGDGITASDSWNTPPSKFSWVQQLGSHFDVPVLNLASSGGSNSLILHNIKMHKWQPGDIALILWTFMERSTIYDDTDTYRHISAYHIENKTKPYVKKYYTLYPNYHVEYVNLQHIEHAYLYLIANNIPMISRFNDNEVSASLDNFHKKMIEDYYKPTLFHMYFLLNNELRTDLSGADGMHYNQLVHSAFADSIKPELAEIIGDKL